MEKRRFEIREYYEAPVCECGGVVCINNGSTMYMGYPPKKDFSCNECGKPMRLSEPDFPGLRYEIIGLNA